MIKVRVTFVESESGYKELEESIDALEKQFEILNKSRIYKGRNGSKFNNVYLDLEKK